MDNLHERNICIVKWCGMCKNSGEATDHLLLNCDQAHSLLSLVFCLFGHHWIMTKRVVDLLACWNGGFGRHCFADLWGAIPLFVMWTIWRE